MKNASKLLISDTAFTTLDEAKIISESATAALKQQ